MNCDISSSWQGMQYPFHSSEVAAVATTYRLIARMWLREIDLPLANELNSDPLRSAYVRVGGTPPPTNAPSLERLAHDYCQLFIGPRDHLPPIQSVWRDGTLQGTAADAMQRYLRLLEWTTPQDLIVDHVGFQLNVMAFWVDQIASEQEGPPDSTGGDPVGALSRTAARFFQDHLAWSERLAVRVQSKAETEFYRSVGRVTQQFLISESERFGELAG